MNIYIIHWNILLNLFLVWQWRQESWFVSLKDVSLMKMAWNFHIFFETRRIKMEDISLFIWNRKKYSKVCWKSMCRKSWQQLSFREKITCTQTHTTFERAQIPKEKSGNLDCVKWKFKHKKRELAQTYRRFCRRGQSVRKGTRNSDDASAPRLTAGRDKSPRASSGMCLRVCSSGRQYVEELNDFALLYCASSSFHSKWPKKELKKHTGAMYRDLWPLLSYWDSVFFLPFTLILPSESLVFHPRRSS